MEIKEAIQILKDHNIWRKGDNEKSQMTNPNKLGIAIDLVVSEFELFSSKKMSFGLWKIKCEDVEAVNKTLWTYKGVLKNNNELKKIYNNLIFCLNDE